MAMNLRSFFRHLEPTFYGGLFDDPLLLLRVRPLGRSLLFDCGRLHHLAKRALTSISAIFVTHAHMDHFMGIDTFVRHTMVSGRLFDIFGPPGLSDRLAAKLAGYDWNLAEDFWSCMRVHEIHPDHIARTLFAGRENYRPHPEGKISRNNYEIYQNDHLSVEADLFDHKIPVLGFRITEKPGFLIEESKIADKGWEKGPWLKELKKNFYAGTLHELISVPSASGDLIDSGEEIYANIAKDHLPASIGYLTDMGFTRQNQRRALEFFSGLTLFVCECTYLRDNLGKARQSYHLCTNDVQEILSVIRPRLFLPVHLSKIYMTRPEDLYREIPPLPSDVTLLRLPDYQTPRPLLPAEVRPPHPCR